MLKQMSLVLASVEKIGVLIQNRQWLVGLAALDWPVKKTFQTLSWLAAGEICEADFRILTPAFIEKLSLSHYQVKTAKKFFSEYNFDSFQVWLESQNIRVSTQLDSDYPALLKQLDLVPPVLWHRGLWPITAKLVAVVGTRHPSPQGMTMTERVVTEIELGFGVVWDMSERIK
jgi:predicted Rossmann fold nucleotide-binding protein DprA/Smf involved in DNA uptake